MQNIVIAIITIIIVSIIVYVIGRITIIISDCILVKQHNKTIRMIDMIQQAAKKRHSAFDYGLMGIGTAIMLVMTVFGLWVLGGAIHKLI
jgi:hypothetical protein